MVRVPLDLEKTSQEPRTVLWKDSLLGCLYLTQKKQNDSLRQQIWHPSLHKLLSAFSLCYFCSVLPKHQNLFYFGTGSGATFARSAAVREEMSLDASAMSSR